MKQQKSEPLIKLSLSNKIVLVVLVLLICFHISALIYRTVALDKIQARENTLEQLYREEFIMPPTAKLKKTIYETHKGVSIYINKEYETDDDPMKWYDYFHEQGKQKGWKVTDDYLYDDGYFIGWRVLNNQYVIYIDVEKKKSKQKFLIHSGATFNDFWHKFL